MLILNRRAGEAILIDGGIRIVVLASDGAGVRLGIEAPSSVGIVREEVVQRIAEENIRAGATMDQREWLRNLEGANPEPEEKAEEDPGDDSSLPDSS
jgi:carbon storage regulator